MSDTQATQLRNAALVENAKHENGRLGCNSMSVLERLRMSFPSSLPHRYRVMEPFPSNQEVKPTAPGSYFAALLATNPARGLPLSR